MAEAVLFDIAARILAKLGSSVLKEFGLWWGLEDELEKLNNTITMIHAVLLDAEKQSSKNNQVKTWLGMLKEAVYDAEDLLDLFSTRALKEQTMSSSKLGKKVQIFFSSSNQFAYGRKMAYKIKSIREKIDEIAKNKTLFMLDVCPIENVDVNTRETHSSLPHIFVGRDNDKEEIMKVLLCSDSKKKLFVISIVGIGGLGKTTLAQLLLDDEEVKNQFELKLWVCVGEKFNKKSIIHKILEAVKGSKPENLELESLKNQLFQSISGKRYVLVLDDVWDENFGECSDLMDLLAEGAKGSRVIITTRLWSVARIARSDLEYELKGLSNDESWDLLKKVAFVGGKVPSSSFEEIGKEIVDMLNGVPLVIRTIGGLLYSKKSVDEWRSLKDRELSTITQLEDNGILPTLRLSYSHLPSHLKQCFAYCRLFPKDYEIHVDTLIELWIAQGFVSSSNATRRLKDIGLQYFKELFSRSFFQEVEENSFGNIYTCKMHDLMHDLSISVVGGEGTSTNSNGFYVDERTRHISIDFELGSQHLPFLIKASKARTFLLLNRGSIGKDECHLVFSNLKCLRALDLQFMWIEIVPHSINKLELLTYLDLSFNQIMKKLPNSICSLQNLQVLKVDFCWRLEELPNDIRKLVKLRCLSMLDCSRLTHMPRGIGQLTSLETLSDFVVDKKGRGAELSELKNLKNLRGSLWLRNLRYAKNPKIDFQALNLRERQHILGLQLEWDSSPKDEDGNGEFSDEGFENDAIAMDLLEPHQNLKRLQLTYYKGAMFSSWLSSLTTLVALTLDNCTNIRSLPPFDQFPALKELLLRRLTNLEYLEIGISCNNGGLSFFFPSLEKLSLIYCPNLKGWVRASRTESTSGFLNFHCLSQLAIYDCPNLDSVPHSPSIKKLDFEGKSMEQLEQLLKSNIEHNTSLSQLKDMTIEGIEEETILDGELQQKLTSLTSLTIYSCPGILEMECPPFGLRCLRNIQFWEMLEMESLPEWLRHLSTLNSLVFYSCPNLASIPVWMSELSSLQHLRIEDCPKLSERCKNMNGEDWPKIAHIPNITIDDSMVQRNGCHIAE